MILLLLACGEAAPDPVIACSDARAEATEAWLEVGRQAVTGADVDAPKQELAEILAETKAAWATGTLDPDGLARLKERAAMAEQKLDAAEALVLDGKEASTCAEELLQMVPPLPCRTRLKRFSGPSVERAAEAEARAARICGAPQGGK